MRNTNEKWELLGTEALQKNRLTAFGNLLEKWQWIRGNYHRNWVCSTFRSELLSRQWIFVADCPLWLASEKMSFE